MKTIFSETLKKVAEELEAGIGRDEYLEDQETRTEKPSKDKEKPYRPAPKIRAPRRQPFYKNEWDNNEKRKEYQQEYRLEHGNGYVKKKDNENG